MKLSALLNETAREKPRAVACTASEAREFLSYYRPNIENAVFSATQI